MNLYDVTRTDDKRHPAVHTITVRAKDERDAVIQIRDYHKLAEHEHHKGSGTYDISEWDDICQDPAKYKVTPIAINTMGVAGVLKHMTRRADNKIGSMQTPQDIKLTTSGAPVAPTAVGVAAAMAAFKAQQGVGNG